MKRILTVLGLIAMLAIVGAGCKKSSGGLTIQGNWELSKISGMAGVTNVAAGNGNTYKFTGNHYYQFTDGTLSASGTFVIIKDDAASVSPLAGHIIYDGNASSAQWFYLQDNNTLVLDFGSAVDGPVKTYVRK